MAVKFCSLLFALFAPLAFARTLDIYVIDVEGGKAMLVRGPSGESMLIDAGWPGETERGRVVKPHDRDTKRILQALREAGVQQLDYMVVTHYDTDHVENVAQLTAQLPRPVRTFVDHGAPFFRGRPPTERMQAYMAVRDKGAYRAVKAGDRIPMQGVEVRVVSSAQQMLPAPEGSPANALCAGYTPPASWNDENAASLGLLFTYGRFRMLDLGDLLKAEEFDLMCPVNRVGTVDLFMAGAHGMDISNSPVLVHALRPRVAITNNGARKGNSPEAWKVLAGSPGIEDIWQLHFTVAQKENNPPENFVANLEEVNCRGYWIKVAAQADGSFEVTNARNGFRKKYAARP